MVVIKAHSISKGNGKFAFPGKARIIEIDDSFRQDEFKGRASRLLQIKFEVIMYAYESPFGGGVVKRETKVVSQTFYIPWLQPIPYKVGEECNCYWVDGFGMEGKWNFDLLDKAEDWENFPLIDNREMLWIKKEFLPQVLVAMPDHWELQGNSVLLPKDEYYAIVLEDNGVLPKHFFLSEVIQNHQSFTDKYVDVINLEEGFSESVSISDICYGHGAYPVYGGYWKNNAKVSDGNSWS